MRSLPLVCALGSALGLLSTPTAIAARTAHVDQPMAMPTYVNLYWDSSWDGDVQGLKKDAIDSVTQALVSTSYFMGLNEYNVQGAAFGGGFLPDPACPAKPPARVGFYDPVNTSIAGFVQCEHDHGPAILRQSGVVYNVILPPFSMESDLWTSNFCSGPGSPIGWHYHGLEDSFPDFFGGEPIYTIVLSSPQCGGIPGLIGLLTHEMVEAATDPYPIDISIIPPHINIETQNEIADFCEGQGAAIFADVSGQTPLFMPITVSSYWSNAKQTCITFGDVTFPTVSGVTVTNWGSQTKFTIAGSGFGVRPPTPNASAPYVEVVDTVHGWAAGDAINTDAFGLSIPAWTVGLLDNIRFTSPNGATPNTIPDAQLLVWVCNPNSLRCVSHQATAAPGPYDPRLTILDMIGGNFIGAADTFTVIENGKTPLMTNVVNRDCKSACVFSTMTTVAPGIYTFTQTVSGPTKVKTVGNNCSQLSLSSGEETSCRISVSGPADPAGCPQPGFKCCEVGAQHCNLCVPPKAVCP